MKQLFIKAGLFMATGMLIGQLAVAQFYDSKFPKIGEAAPPLTVMKWVKGKPVGKYEKGKMYLIEFTGTGCPPCRRAMPHLTRLSRQYGDKVQIVSVFDGLMNTGLPEYMGVFNALITDYGDKMDYTIAVDKENAVTCKAWGVSGVPQAFLVDGDGKVAWHGHPADMDVIIENAAAGNIKRGVDLQNAERERITPVYVRIEKLKAAGNWQEAVRVTDSLIAALPVEHPSRQMLFYEKFSALAGNDDKQGYEWVRYMLSDENREYMKSFDWDHFISDVQYNTKEKDYDMVLQVIDRCIELAEYRYIAGVMNHLKALVYSQWSAARTDKEEAKQDLKHAAEMYGNAIGLFKQSGEDNKYIAEMYADRSKIQANPADAAEDRKQALAYYQKAKDWHQNSKAPVKRADYIAGIEEKMAELK